MLLLTALSRSCHAFEFDTEERKTIRLESGSASTLIVADKTVAIVFLTTIIIWEPGSILSWRLDTPPVSLCYTWAHYLDPVRKVVSRFECSYETLSVIMRDFSYGARESMQHAQLLKYSPLKRHDVYEIDARVPCNRLKITVTLQNGFTTELMNFVGQQLPALKHCATKNEWTLINHARIPPELCYSCDNVYITDDSFVFCSSFRDNSRSSARVLRILFPNEDRWIEWPHPSWKKLERIVKITGRYAIVISTEGQELRMQVRVFMGIHERRATEKQLLCLADAAGEDISVSHKYS